VYKKSPADREDWQGIFCKETVFACTCGLFYLFLPSKLDKAVNNPKYL